MLLKKIELKNIRSYTHEKIEFSEGSVLLSGDIGSGKSSILLALEFALFGIMKGDISGSNLLRHGEKEGFVQVTLQVNSKEIVIKRVLKRTSAGIGQESGSMTIDGVKTDLVATELKARILKILGYPESLVSKSKSLTYRYTVYTPQEEMKRIILSKPEERLDILRSVFGIDKYKTIRENAAMYVRELKRKISFAQGQVLDIDEVKKELLEKTKAKDEVKKELERQKPSVDKIKEEAKTKSGELEKIEAEIERIREERSILRIIESKLQNAEYNLKNTGLQAAKTKEEVKDIEKDTKEERKVNESKLNDAINLIKNRIEENSEKLEEVNKKVAELEYRKNEALDAKEGILKLTKCPTCRQDVTPGHKHLISNQNEDIAKNAEKNLKELSEIREKVVVNKDILGKKLQSFENIKKNAEINKIKQSLLEEKKKNILSLQKEAETQKNNIKELEKQKASLKLQLETSKKVESDFTKIREELLKLSQHQKEEEVKLVRLEEQKNSIEGIIEGLKKEIEKKNEQKQKIAGMLEVQRWFSEFFENLIVSMEKHVMAGIYHEFNELVKKWFLALIGDENIEIRLDNEFTPTLEQNGYETDISNLSGGEKTAVALAYRLALNKVINDMISMINTKDLIILDEPTDGFSDTQLDRVRDVLDDLDLKQIIIVSHEQKIESFVENVIRISKEGHESRVANH